MVCPFCQAAVTSSSPCPHVLLGFEGTTPFGAGAPRHLELLQICIDDFITFPDEEESMQIAVESTFGMIMDSGDIRQEWDGLKAVFIRDPSRAKSLIEERLPLEL